MTFCFELCQSPTFKNSLDLIHSNEILIEHFRVNYRLLKNKPINDVKPILASNEISDNF